jgi:PAS domain S-box-containing protein
MVDSHMTTSSDHSGWLAGAALPAAASAPAVDENARLAGIVRSSHDAIFGGTLDGVVTAWNRAAEQLYGYSADEIIGRRTEELCPPESRAGEAAVLRRIARGERLDPYVGERLRRDGSTVLVRLSVSPVVDDAGEIVGVACASRAEVAPVPDPAGGRRDLRQFPGQALDPDKPGPALDLDKAGQTRGILPARASHELRTPLQAIIGFTGTLLLRLPGPLNDEQERQLELVQESARQLLLLINQLSRPVDH